MKEQIFLLHNLEFVWTLDKKNKRKENLLTTLVISAWQEHIHWLYPSVTFFVSKFWRSCEKSYGNSVNTLWSALKALTRKYALSSNCYFQSWLISFKSLVKAHRVCRLSYFWNIKLKLLRKVSNPGTLNFWSSVFTCLISAWRASCQLNWTWKDYESNAQLFPMHIPSKKFVNFDDDKFYKIKIWIYGAKELYNV